MKKLIIEEIENYNYFLKDTNNKIYRLNIEFYDLNSKPQKGDYLYINEETLEEKIPLSFGPLDGTYGRDIKNEDDKDLLVLVINNQKNFLKRYYG